MRRMTVVGLFAVAWCVGWVAGALGFAVWAWHAYRRHDEAV